MSRARDAIHPMPEFPRPPSPGERSTGFAARIRIAWTPGVTFRAGRVAIGGSPWQLTVLPPAVRPFAHALHAAGRAGLVAATPQEQSAAVYLLDRGIADPWWTTPRRNPTPPGSRRSSRTTGRA